MIQDYADGSDTIAVAGIGGIGFETAAGGLFAVAANTGGFTGLSTDTVIVIDSNGVGDSGDDIVALVLNVSSGDFDV